MKRIKIIREKGFYGKLRALKLVVDGQIMGKVKQGCEVEITLPTGAQRLWGKMDWGKTAAWPVADIPDGGTLVFKAYFTLNTLRQLGLMPLPFRIMQR